MIIGTYKVKIDTDSLSIANDTDIEIVLSKEKAHQFKRNIMAIMDKEESFDAALDFKEDENIEYDLVYSNKDVVNHCFYNLSTGKLFSI